MFRATLFFKLYIFLILCSAPDAELVED